VNFWRFVDENPFIVFIFVLCVFGLAERAIDKLGTSRDRQCHCSEKAP
jgi:hypothetical protein